MEKRPSLDRRSSSNFDRRSSWLEFDWRWKNRTLDKRHSQKLQYDNQCSKFYKCFNLNHTVLITAGLYNGDLHLVYTMMWKHYTGRNMPTLEWEYKWHKPPLLHMTCRKTKINKMCQQLNKCKLNKTTQPKGVENGRQISILNLHQRPVY